MSTDRRPEYLENGLPKTYRLITDHDAKGKAVFSTTIDEAQQWQVIATGANKEANFALNYTTSQFPVSFKGNQDIDGYKQYLDNKPGLSIPGGLVVVFMILLLIRECELTEMPDLSCGW